jgi:NCS1 family nucleobase:cation symporter-1
MEVGDQIEDPRLAYGDTGSEYDEERVTGRVEVFKGGDVSETKKIDLEG